MCGRIVRLSKKNTIYIPKDLAEKAGIREGVLLEISVENGRVVLTPIPDPLWLALYGPKFAEITVEEVEKYSEEMQEGYLKKPKPLQHHKQVRFPATSTHPQSLR